MTEEQFSELIELLTDIKNGIDELTVSENFNGQKLDAIKSVLDSINRSTKH